MDTFERLRGLGDEALLAAIRALYVPGRRDPDLRALVAGLAGRRVLVPVPGGSVSVDLGEWTSFVLIRLGAWEPHLVPLAQVVVKPGDVAIDVGAHVGTWTLLLASLVGQEGRVVAYEPHAGNAGRAGASVIEAGFGDRATVHAAAVGEVDGEATLFTRTDASGHDAMLGSLVGGEGGDLVRVLPLDAAGIDRVDFLKIDTEGFELSVLRGARGLLSRSPGVTVLVELHAEELRAQGVGVEDVRKELESQGFQVFDVRPDGAELVIEVLAEDAAPTTHHVVARRDPAGFRVELG